MAVVLTSCGGGGGPDGPGPVTLEPLEDTAFLNYIEYTGLEGPSNVTSDNGVLHVREWIAASQLLKAGAYVEDERHRNRTTVVADHEYQFQRDMDANGDGLIRIDYKDFTDGQETYDGTVLVQVKWNDDGTKATFDADFRNLNIRKQDSDITYAGTIVAELEFNKGSRVASTYTGDIVIARNLMGSQLRLDNFVLSEREDLPGRPASFSGRLYIGDLGYFDIQTDVVATRPPRYEENAFLSGRFLLQTGTEVLSVEPLTKRFMHVGLSSSVGGVPNYFFRINQDGELAGLPFLAKNPRPQYSAEKIYMSGRTGEPLTLDIKGAATPRGKPYTVEWVLLSAPVGATDIMTDDRDDATIEIIPPVEGRYILEAQMTAGGSTGGSVFVITAKNFIESREPPYSIHRVQIPRWMEEGEPFVLSPGISHNINGEPLDLRWTIADEDGNEVLEVDSREDVHVDGLPAGNYSVEVFGDASALVMLRVGDARVAFEDMLSTSPFNGEFLSQMHLAGNGSLLLEASKIGTTRSRIIQLSDLMPVTSYRLLPGNDESNYTIVGSGDLDGDGFEDLVTAVNILSFAVFPGTSTGEFGEAIHLEDRIGNNWWAVSDFDGNGRKEIVHTGYPGVSIFELDADFQVAINHGASGITSFDGILVDDVDGDGDSDLVGHEYSGCWIETWQSEGIGTFSFHSDTRSAANCPLYTFHGGDINNDGRLDLAVYDRDPDTGYIVPAVLMQQPDGSFASVELENFPLLFWPSQVLVGDLDGKIGDEFVYVFREGNLGIVGMSEEGIWTENWQIAVSGVNDYMPNLMDGGFIGDVNGDGKPDVVLLSAGGFNILRQR